ncbi:MAG TPA: hypothetical protein VFC57_08410, partial [Aeromicrobium sp.]|nr:hypothetical protein [Aeromicrobium sp.]
GGRSRIDDQLVGVTFECNEPERARLEKRIVVGGKDTSDMSPVDIDAYVRTQLSAGDDLYTLTEGALTDLDPELILTQDLCRVCAIGTSQVDDALEHAEVVAKELPGVAIWAIDGDAVVVRPGPRVGDGVEAMASILHPNAVPPSHSVRRITPD